VCVCVCVCVNTRSCVRVSCKYRLATLLAVPEATPKCVL
jgi:hypothetical protein